MSSGLVAFLSAPVRRPAPRVMRVNGETGHLTRMSDWCYTSPVKHGQELLARWERKHGEGSLPRLAREAGLSDPVLYRARSGARSVGLEAAHAIERITGIPAESWIRQRKRPHRSKRVRQPQQK